MNEPLIIGIVIILCLAFVLGMCGRKLGRNGSSFISVITLGGVIFTFISNGYEPCFNGNTKFIIIGDWILSSFDWSLWFDSVSLEMCLLISTITFCVLLYSSEYMFHDPHIIRFLSLLVLFAFFMIVLVTSGNFLQMFIGWEGVGFVSFLLINFWFMRLEANRSAVKAMLFNRIGDSFYLIGVILVFFFFKSTDIIVFNYIPYYDFSKEAFILNIFGFNFEIFELFLLFFFLAAVGKSAQIGLHAWLPDAMEGPTPVSSLLHSATMVTAGVFLLIRISPVLHLNENVWKFCIFIGAITAFLNALWAFLQFDIKKIIAFSTCSQLGLMVVGLFENVNISFYHLINHGGFKALLFLSAGSVIHALGGEQDIRKMGGLFFFLPFSSTCFLIGSLALSGFPFLSGFYSKEFLLFNLYNTNQILGSLNFWLLFFASVFTVLYSIKILNLVFLSKIYKNSQNNLIRVHEPGYRMKSAMVILTILALFCGFFLEDLFNLLGTGLWFGNFGYLNIFENNYLNLYFSSEISSFILKWFLVILFVYSIYTALRLNKSNIFFVNWLLKNKMKLYLFLFWCLSNKLGFISLYRKIASNFLLLSYKIFFILIDRGIFELLGPTQIIRIIKNYKLYFYNFYYYSFLNIFILFSIFIILLFLMLNVKYSLLMFSMGLFVFEIFII